MARSLLDTNVLVYFYDHNSPQKQSRARALVGRLAALKSGFISAQSLAEFANSTMRKLRPPFTPSEVLAEANLLVEALQVLPLTSDVVIEAVGAVRDHQLSYYDAQIWACARLNQVPVVFSEDFQDGQLLEGVKFVNPFTDQFDIEAW